MWWRDRSAGAAAAVRGPRASSIPADLDHTASPQQLLHVSESSIWWVEPHFVLSRYLWAKRNHSKPSLFTNWEDEREDVSMKRYYESHSSMQDVLRCNLIGCCIQARLFWSGIHSNIITACLSFTATRRPRHAHLKEEHFQLMQCDKNGLILNNDVITLFLWSTIWCSAVLLSNTPKLFCE